MMDKPAVGMKELIETIERGGAAALSDIGNIESALELVKKYQEQVEDLKNFKKQKIQVISQEIESVEGKISFIRSIVAETLKSANKKSVKFPGLGKVSHSVRKGAWNISDEESLAKILKEEGETECYENKVVLKKTPLYKLLDIWIDIGKIPDGVAERGNERDSVTITFDKPVTEPTSVPVAKKAVDELDIDAIDFANG